MITIFAFISLLCLCQITTAQQQEPGNITLIFSCWWNTYGTVREWNAVLGYNSTFDGPNPLSIPATGSPDTISNILLVNGIVTRDVTTLFYPGYHPTSLIILNVNTIDWQLIPGQKINFSSNINVIVPEQTNETLCRNVFHNQCDFLLELRSGYLNNPSSSVCEDGSFCNGFEFCDSDNLCQSGEPPCSPDESCNETSLLCVLPEPVPTSPTVSPTFNPINIPPIAPTLNPTFAPNFIPTLNPTNTPTSVPTLNPTFSPIVSSTNTPTGISTLIPTLNPTFSPTRIPTASPTTVPTF